MTGLGPTALSNTSALTWSSQPIVSLQLMQLAIPILLCVTNCLGYRLGVRPGNHHDGEIPVIGQSYFHNVELITLGVSRLV